MFNLALVDDEIVYKDESNKRLGYDVKGGKKSLSTDMIYNVTARSSVYKRKKSVKMEGKSTIKLKSASKLSQSPLSEFEQ